MKDNSEKDAKQPKKPYIKPEVRQVPLRPGEAVLGGCKVTPQAQPGGICGVTCYNSGS